MTAVLILLVLSLVAYTSAVLRRDIHRDRARSIPASHLDWGTTALPSHPFAADV